MIGYIKGIVAEKTDERVVLDRNGMGYIVKCPASVIEAVAAVGETCKLYTYMYVREDKLELFGFETKHQLELFELLITVNGVGPKAGMAILSTMSVSALMMAIVSQDAKAIAKAPGVGPKAAQKIILDLKDKVAAEDILYQEVADDVEAVVSGDSSAKSEAIMALNSLGYDYAESTRAVNQVKITEDMDAGKILQQALKQMNR